MNELGEELPGDPILDVGYYESRQKVWVVSPKDLDIMYEKRKGGDVLFWIELCDDIDETDSDASEPKRKKKKKRQSSVPSRRQSKEDELEEVYSKLRIEHGTDYSVPQLKLWARMIICGTHDNYTDPPRVPMIMGKHSKLPKPALTGAAEAMARVFSPPTQPVSVTVCTTASTIASTTASSSSTSTAIGISPGKATDLRMRNLEQLRVLQKLYEEKILTETEFLEQKNIILASYKQNSN